MSSESYSHMLDWARTRIYGKVDEPELYNILKHKIFNHDDKMKLKQTVRQIFKENDLDGDGNLDRDEPCTAITKNMTLRGLFGGIYQKCEEDRLIY